MFDTPTGRVIDAMLVSESVVTKARQRLKDEHSIGMSVKWLRMRKNELIKAKITLEKAVSRQNDEERQADPKTVEETLDTFLTLGKTAMSVIDLVLEANDPQRNALIAVQAQMNSVLRRAREFRENFDHLSEMRWLLNLMEIRISKMFELEIQMGIPMRDNTTNIQAMMTMIQQSIELHQSLGLKPRFGDPKLNININVGGTAGGNELQSERFKRLKELAERYAKASPEDQVRMRHEMLVETKLAHPVPVDAQFKDVKS